MAKLDVLDLLRPYHGRTNHARSGSRTGDGRSTL